MQVATGFEPCSQLGNQWGLNQPALVVFFLMPRVREKDVNTVQAVQRQHVVNHLDRVVLHDANVGKALRFNPLEQCAHAGRVHLAAQKISAR